MASTSCKKCGKAIQDSFVFVDNNELNSHRNRSIASLNQTLMIKGKLEELVTNTTRTKTLKRPTDTVGTRITSSPSLTLSEENVHNTAESTSSDKVKLEQITINPTENKPKREEKEICFDCTQGIIDELDKQI